MDVKDCSGQSSCGQPHSQIWILIFVVFFYYSPTAIRVFNFETKAILSDLERDRAFLTSGSADSRVSLKPMCSSSFYIDHITNANGNVS